MKKAIVTFMAICMAVVMPGCPKASGAATAEQMLRDFYTQYITETSEIYNASIVAEIKKNFLTKELINRLEETELDYDPFLNAQDCDLAWLKTLEINPVLGSDKDDAYRVCFGDEHVICLTLFLVRLDGKWLINDIEGLPDVGQAAETENEVVPENEEGGFREIGLDEKIGSQTLIDYLADTAIPQTFKSVFLQDIGLDDNDETFALIDSLSSTDKLRHPFYFVLVTRALWWSDGAFSEALAIAVRKYVETDTQQFLDYFLTEEVLTESDFIQWSRMTFDDMSMEWETMENAGKYIEDLRKRMKENCVGCSSEKLKLIDQFIDYMYSFDV